MNGKLLLVNLCYNIYIMEFLLLSQYDVHSDAACILFWEVEKHNYIGYMPVHFSGY